jgi:type VI secretion system protein ImpB
MAADQGSVAPKERVNISYKAATGDAVEQKELPLKLFVMGDFTGRADSTPLENRKAVNVDKDNFNDVLSAHKVELTASVKNALTDEKGAELPVSLKFKNMRDFEPEQVAKQVPELKKLICPRSRARSATCRPSARRSRRWSTTRRPAPRFSTKSNPKNKSSQGRAPVS